MTSKVDEAIESAGAYGRYQLFQATLASLGSFAACLHALVLVFHSITPDHRCVIPGLANDSYGSHTNSSNTSLWIPITREGLMDSCTIYQFDNNFGTAQKCDQHVFSKQKYWGTSLNEQFELVCDRKKLSTATKMVYTLGLLIGSALVGFLSDIYGRRILMVTCMLTGGLLGVAASFSINIYMYMVLRFLIAICFIGATVLAHCIIMEITGPSRRPLAIAVRNLFWPMAQCLLSLMAYYIQDWNRLQLACSIPALVFGILQLIFLKETPHFLITKNRYNEAFSLFHLMAKINNRVPPTFVEEDKNAFNSRLIRERLKSLIRNPVLLKRSLIFFYLWFIAGMSYFGLNINVGSLTGSIYINTMISGLAEIPVGLLILLSHKTGRKGVTLLCILVSGASLITVALMYVFVDLSEAGYALIAVTNVGKLAVTGVVMFNYMWSSEVFPSSLRASLVGLCSMLARMGTLLSPLVVDLYMYFDTVFKAGLGPLLFGVTMCTGSVLIHFLPETDNKRIPETILEANKFETNYMASEAGLAEADGEMTNTYTRDSDKFESTKL